MNTLIQELANRAKSQVPQGILSPELWIEQYNQRFAELIVTECINIVEVTDHHRAWAADYVGGVDGIELLDSKVHQIKQHFGVK